MQAPPPPPPPLGHHGTYRPPYGITTRAASLQAQQQHHQHLPTPHHQPLPTPSFPPQPPSRPSNPSTTIPTHNTLHTTPPPRTYQPPPLPNDFVTSPDFHDCRVIFGHDLPKVVKRTAWSEKLGIAGCPMANTANAGSHETLMGLVLDPKRLPRPGNIPSVHAQRLDIDRGDRRGSLPVRRPTHPTLNQKTGDLGFGRRILRIYEWFDQRPTRQHGRCTRSAIEPPRYPARARARCHKSPIADKTVGTASTIHSTSKTTGTPITRPDSRPHTKRPHTTRTSDSVHPKFTSSPFNSTSHSHRTRQPNIQHQTSRDSNAASRRPKEAPPYRTYLQHPQAHPSGSHRTIPGHILTQASSDGLGPSRSLTISKRCGSTQTNCCASTHSFLQNSWSGYKRTQKHGGYHSITSESYRPPTSFASLA